MSEKRRPGFPEFVFNVFFVIIFTAILFAVFPFASPAVVVIGIVHLVRMYRAMKGKDEEP
ncbi:MAG: hypothetical protein N3B13_10185 [Deltaproteobacteria bacterium]|nr:hypothetical protein [Deltaproteobacteria bacterium]